MTYGLDSSVVLRILTNRPLKLATNAIVRIHRMQLAGELHRLHWKDSSEE